MGSEHYDAEQLTRAAAEEAVLARVVTPLPSTSMAVDEVRSMGVALIADGLSVETAISLRGVVLKELAQAQVDVTGFDDGEEHAHFSAVMAAAATSEAIADGVETRWDLRLPLSPPVHRALRELLSGPVGLALEELVGGQGELHELAAVVSAPGAAPQVVHSDADWSDSASMFSAFIALQHVSLSMGPTIFLRSTHTAEAHTMLSIRPGDFLATADARAAMLRCGEASLYDRRLLHAGGRNWSDSERVLFYATFRRAGADGDVWNANSLRSEYRGALCLQQLRDSPPELLPIVHVNNADDDVLGAS